MSFVYGYFNISNNLLEEEGGFEGEGQNRESGISYGFQEKKTGRGWG